MTTQVEEPSNVDVLCGRGGKTNHHPGNILFREMISDHHQEYIECERNGKTAMTRELLLQFRAQGVRFLREDPSSGCWCDVGDQLARTKISQALRDNTTDGIKEKKGRGKRIIEAEGKPDDTKRAKLPVEPSGTTIDATPSVKSNTPREVSPVPSTSNSIAFSPCAEQKPRPSHTRKRTSIILPPDASLFEILEGSDVGLDTSSLPSKALAGQTSPFVLPELPPAEIPLRLPSIIKDNLADDVSIENALSLNREFSMGSRDDVLEETPREVSPLPGSIADNGFFYQSFGPENDDGSLFEVPVSSNTAAELDSDPYVNFFDDESPLLSELEEHDRNNGRRLSLLLQRYTDGFSSISQLSNDDVFAGSKESAFNPVQPSAED